MTTNLSSCCHCKCLQCWTVFIIYISPNLELLTMSNLTSNSCVFINVFTSLSWQIMYLFGVHEMSWQLSALPCCHELTIGDEFTNQAVTTLSPIVMILYSWWYLFRQVLEYTHTLFSKSNSVNCLNPTKRIKMTVSLPKLCENIYYLQYLLSICFNSSLQHSYIRYIYLMFFISAVEFWYARSK